MWAAVEPGLQPEVVLLAGVDYLKAQGSGKPERGKKFHPFMLGMGQKTEGS